MLNHDAGHSHGPTLGFVTGCPLCDAAKTARNQAIAHLSEALHLLSLINSAQARPTIRLNIAPIGLTGDDVPHCHSIDLTPKQAEGLADAVDSMNAHLGSESAEGDQLIEAFRQAEDAIEIDEDRMARSTARFMGWLQGQTGEAIESGEWSAAAVAQHSPEAAAFITDTFTDLDLRQITKEILDETEGSKLAKTLLLDEWFGEIADAYADEDGEL